MRLTSTSHQRKLVRILSLGFQIILAVMVLLPFFWMVSVSLKPATEAFAIPARLWPEHPTLENYASAFRPEFQRYFLNSVVVSLTTLVITVTLALLAAYSFTRFQMRILSILLVGLIVAQMFREISYQNNVAFAVRNLLNRREKVNANRPGIERDSRRQSNR